MVSCGHPSVATDGIVQSCQNERAGDKFFRVADLPLKMQFDARFFTAGAHYVRFRARPASPSIEVQAVFGDACLPKGATTLLDDPRGSVCLVTGNRDDFRLWFSRGRYQFSAHFWDGFSRALICHQFTARVARLVALPYPADLVLFAGYLAARECGIIAHSCGIGDHGKGLLFVGMSGSGKSTLGRLYGASRCLSDDRVIVTKSGSKYLLFGFPWNHPVEAAHPSTGVRLSAIFYISHGQRNLVRACPKGLWRPLAMQCLHPTWDAESLAFSIAFCKELTWTVPTYRLAFLPNLSVLDVLNTVCGNRR